MKLSYIKKILVVCTITCCFLLFAILENHIVVMAKDATSVTSVDGDIGFQEPDKEYSGLVDGKTTKRVDIKDIISSVFTEMLGACLGFLSSIDKFITNIFISDSIGVEKLGVRFLNMLLIKCNAIVYQYV